MKIAVDVDGVILDIMTPFSKMFNEKHGTHYSLNDMIKWDFFLDWDVSEKEFLEMFEKIFKNEVRAKLIDDAIPEIMKVLNQNHNIDLLTARENTYKRQLIDTLKKWGIIKSVHYNKLLMVGNTTQDIKLNYEYDVYIDDNPFLIKAISKKKYRHLLLFDQPWNQQSIKARNITRVYSWEEILEEVSNISNI